MPSMYPEVSLQYLLLNGGGIWSGFAADPKDGIKGLFS